MSYGKVEQIGNYRQQCRGMYDLLYEYAKSGISLYLEGKEAEPGQIAATCLREGVSYMMDFIPEDPLTQKISKIDFIKVDVDCPAENMEQDTQHPNIAAMQCS